MESRNYKDTVPAQQLDNSTLNKMVWRSLFLQASFNYERMQAGGWLYAILPGLEKIHTNKDDLSTSMKHNLEFFNTHPFLVTLVMGIVLSLEQEKADVDTIRAVRVAAMGPLGGIGDAIFWLTLVPIAAGITSNMALEGSFVAPFLFLLIFNVVQFLVRYWLMHWSYKTGTEAVTILTANAKEFTRAATMLGVFVVGALVSNFGATSIRISRSLGEGAYLEVQKILDGILPMLVPLLLTFLVYHMIKKYKWTPLKCIGLLLAISMVGTAFGIFAADAGTGEEGGYTPLVEWYEYAAPSDDE